jgi:hypothetical protein
MVAYFEGALWKTNNFNMLQEEIFLLLTSFQVDCRTENLSLKKL